MKYYENEPLKTLPQLFKTANKTAGQGTIPMAFTWRKYNQGYN